VMRGKKLTNGKSKSMVICVSPTTGVAAFIFSDGIKKAMKVLSKNSIVRETKYKILKDFFFNIELLLLLPFICEYSIITGSQSTQSL
jgi:hypothetical protein